MSNDVQEINHCTVDDIVFLNNHICLQVAKSIEVLLRYSQKSRIQWPYDTRAARPAWLRYAYPFL
jgi:hypothetical protein